ncbi:AAA family ATPase [Pseudonocardia zijingensis]|uniref:Novel STAND NTPase 1 domain-containing protein n=1 Tax=Pseudonocardia zijingensis TaxID=153376 RepID=A0ABP4AKQ5_9PSEU
MLVNATGSVFREHADLAGAHLRVWSGSGEVAGAGFLIGPDLLVTAARAVADHGRPVWLDFPLLRDEHGEPVRVPAVSEPARPGGVPGDVALLRVRDAVPLDARVPPLRRVSDLDGSGFQVLGYPEGLVDGVWSAGTVRVEDDGRIRLDPAPGEHPLDTGFAGAPVWHAAGGAVVGVTVVDERGAHLVPVDRVLGVDPDALPCPYQGLRPFDEEHAEVFFGRDDEIDRLLAAVDRLPVVAVTGPSGAGKSSLVRAGLLPRLRAAGVDVLDLRITPGSGVPASPAEVPAGRGARQVVVADQFEELAASDPEAARGLLESILRITRPDGDGPRARAVLTLRWSTLDELLTPDLADALHSGRLLVAPLDRGRLREAIVRPARLAPGLVFEHGLVERILDDTGTEPGQLPLVESLLAELWERREGGYLTMADYTAVGGVAGALAQHAERVVGGLDAEPDALRGLFTALTGVDRAGRFTRRAVRLDALPEAQRALVPALVAGRLLVRNRSSAETSAEVVEPAHQALLEHWPRLREWLTEDRDFLVWRSELAAQRERWEDEDRDDAALPRGAALATAAGWLGTRADELPAADRDFLRRGIARQRRDVRRSRIVNAVLAVLVLGAATLGGATVYSGNRIAEQLATANAETLGVESQNRAPGDSAVAAQLALAAWRSDPENRQARTALARSALAMRSVRAVVPEVAPRPVHVLSRNGDTALLDSAPGLVAVTGVSGADPVPHALDDVGAGATIALSQDGRWFADVGPDGRVQLRDLVTGEPPQTLPNVPAAPPDAVTNLQFSDDGDRLAWVVPGATGGWNLVIRDRRSGAEIPHGLGPLPAGDRFDLRLTADPDVVVLRYADSPWTATTRLVTRSLVDGSLVAEFPAESMPNREGVVSCEQSDGSQPGLRATVVVTPLRGGPPSTRIPVDGTAICFGMRLSGSWLVEPALPGVDEESYRLTHLATGERRRVTLPRSLMPLSLANVSLARADRLSVEDGAGEPTVLVAHGRSLLRLATEPAEPLGGARSDIARIGTRDHRVVRERDLVRVLERGTGREVAAMELPVATNVLMGDRDQLWVVHRLDSGEVDLTWYELPTLRRTAGVRVPARPGVPPAAGATRGAVSYHRESVDGRDRLLVLSEGVLSTWDAATGQPLAAPVPIGPPEDAAAYRLRSLLHARPGHPGQVAVSTHERQVQLWDVPAGRQLATIPVEPNPDLTQSGNDVLEFDPTGARLAVLAAGAIEYWDVDAVAPVRPPVPAPLARDLAGFDPDGRLVTFGGATLSDSTLAFVDLDTGQERGSVEPRLGFDQLTDDGLRVALHGDQDAERYEFPLDARAWAEQLCTWQARPFTDTELGLLPPGVSTAPPCS